MAKLIYLSGDIMRGYIELSKKQLIDNYLKIKEETQKDVICVIKTNAYGHGLIEVAKILATQGPKMFAVSTLEEGMLIRKSLIFTPILLLGTCDNLLYASNFRITLSTVSLTYLKRLQKANIPLFIHLLINTGMNRDGILLDEIPEALDIIKKSKLILKGVFTHFASAETYENQMSIFLNALDQIPTKKLIIHSQASSTFLIKNEKMTAVRVGLALYGLAENVSFTKPILTLKSQAICEYSLPINSRISYSQTPLASEGFVYTLPLGYGDGLLRTYTYKVLSGDEQYSQIGVTCMDHLMIFSPKKLKMTDEFTIIGPHNPIISIAQEANMTPYEIACHLSPRLKRIIK